jgi:hypothetical protein
MTYQAAPARQEHVLQSNGHHRSFFHRFAQFLEASHEAKAQRIAARHGQDHWSDAIEREINEALRGRDGTARDF